MDLNKDLFLPNELKTDDDMVSYDYFVDFMVVNDGKELGKISYVDDQTVNILFGITTNEGDILLPAVEDFIVEVDNVNKVLYTNFPEELVDLNKNF